MKANLISLSIFEIFDVHFNMKQMLFNKGLKNEIQTHILLVLKSTSFNEYTKQMQQADNELYWWKLQRRAVHRGTQKTQHSVVTVTAPQSSDQIEWEPTNVAAARVSTWKQPQANWVLEEAIKQCCKKKLCIHCGASEHFKSNCSYHSVQWFMTSTIIANITIIVSEIMICELDVMEISDLKKK